jgi:LacI family transcriptional regulator
MEKKPATMRDVARRAGVHQSTVSRVLGTPGGTSISADVSNRIRRVARVLDYRRNPSAVALRTGATRTVMVVVTDTADMYFSHIISGIQDVLVAEGYSLVLHSLAHDGPHADLPRFLRRYHLDGALMLGFLPKTTDDDIMSLAGRGLPVVLIGRSLKSGALPSVTAANREGGRLAASHLWSLGHRRIAVMRGPRGWPDIIERVDGFRRELAEAGARPDLVRMFSSGSRRMASGYAAMKGLLATWKPTAVFSMNDSTAIGAIRALREKGLRIPEDVSVVGFDDGELAEFSWPPLTTVRQPRQQMGREGARELVRAMRGEGASRAAQVFDVHLVVRASTCPPR